MSTFLAVGSQVSDTARVVRPLVLGAVALPVLWLTMSAWRSGELPAGRRRTRQRYATLGVLAAVVLASGAAALAEALRPSPPPAAVAQAGPVAAPRVRSGPVPQSAGGLTLLSGAAAERAATRWPPLLSGQQWFYGGPDGTPAAVLLVRAPGEEPAIPFGYLRQWVLGGREKAFGEAGPDGQVWCGTATVATQDATTEAGLCHWAGKLSEGVVILPGETSLDAAATATRAFREALATAGPPARV